MNNKTKSLLTCMILLCILPMNYPWFGFAAGIQEISGWIVLRNPITIFAISLSLYGIWLLEEKYNYIVSTLGILLFLVMEFYYFLTWYLPNISSHFHITKSFDGAYPSFYIGITMTILLLIINIICHKRKKLHENDTPLIF